MRILFLVISLPDLSKRSLYSDFINEVAAKGHDVKVVSPANEGQSVGLHTENGISVVRFKSDRFTGVKSFIKKGLTYMKLMYKYPRAVNKYFSKDQFDLIYINSIPLEMGVVAWKLKRKYRAKVFVMLTDFLWQDLVSLKILNKRNPIITYYRLLEKNFYKTADYIAGLSQGYLDMVNSYYPFAKRKSQSVIVPWSHEDDIKRDNKGEILDKFGLKGKFVAIYGGNIGIAQDIDIVINIAEYCKEERDIVFVIVGRGSKFESIRREVSLKGLKNIILLDFMPKEEYLQLVSVCDVGIISLNSNLGAPNYPSKSSSLFSLSIPVVASIDSITDYGNYLDKYKMGLWSYSSDTESFRDNILRLYKSPELRDEMAKNARTYYCNYMTLENAYKSFINLIE